MHQQVEFQASPSATVAGQWIGLVVDVASGRVLTQTGLTYGTSDEARYRGIGAWIKWLNRQQMLRAATRSVA